MIRANLVVDRSRSSSAEGDMAGPLSVELAKFGIDIVESALALEEIPLAVRSPESDVWVIRAPGYYASESWRASLATAAKENTRRPVVAVCAPGEEDDIRAALHGRVASVVLTDDSPGHYLAAVLSAADGSLFISPRLLGEYAGQVIDIIGARHRARLAALTERERQVLGRMAEGCTNSVIAERLHVGRATVATHVLSILRKLGAANRTEAAAIACREGLDLPALLERTT